MLRPGESSGRPIMGYQTNLIERGRIMTISSRLPNWALWEAWYEQRDNCGKNNIHTLDHNFRQACCHKENTGNLTVLTTPAASYKRCNIFFCPHKRTVGTRAATLNA